MRNCQTNINGAAITKGAARINGIADKEGKKIVGIKYDRRLNAISKSKRNTRGT